MLDLPSTGIWKNKIMSKPYTIEHTNISQAWLAVLKYIVSNPGKEITPLVLSITEFEESIEIKTALDRHLNSNNLDSIDTVAETIFPQSLFKICKGDRNELFRRYARNLPRIKAVDPRNANGTYFERLTSYGDNAKVNQLEIIIESLQANATVKRRSKLQASIFDPLKDHKSGMFQGFPCLQHVTFYKSESGGLQLNSFYAMQYLYQRGYGNWLGLINLGRFVANEVGLEFERFNCIVGVEQLDHLNKGVAAKLLQDLNQTSDNLVPIDQSQLQNANI